MAHGAAPWTRVAADPRADPLTRGTPTCVYRHGAPACSESLATSAGARRVAHNFAELPRRCGPSDGLTASAGLVARSTKRSTPVTAGLISPGGRVLVAGATGGTGQRLTTRLLEAGYQVRVPTRNKEKAEEIFGRDNPNLEVIVCDMGNLKDLEECMKDVDAVVCLVGTTAFPTDRWMKGSTAEISCDVIPHNLIKATPKTIQRFVMVTSAGVERVDEIPFNILNSFKVLTYKRKAEESLMDSGLPYTIFRPDRLTDGPWTSTDLNTLLKADTGGSRPGVQLSLKDVFGKGQASRISVAEALLQCLQISCTEGHAYSITSTADEGPQKDPKKWEKVFATVQ